MAHEVLLPKQGNTVESCIIIDWAVREGDTVREGQKLCDVETDKATFEVESTAAGTVLKLLYSEGDEAPVMQPIAIVGEEGEKVDVSPAAPDAHSEDRKIRISPRARQRAAKAGIDPSGLTGSGPGGRILVRDVEQAISEGSAPAAAGSQDTGGARGELETGAGGTAGAASAGAAAGHSGPAPAATGAPNLGEPAVAGTTPVRGVRARIAERMHASLRDTAQLTMDMSADARGLERLRAKFKQKSEQLGIPSISIGEMVAFAAARTLTRHTGLNSHMHADEIVHYRDVHLGLAVDTERGLIVPVIRGANARSLVSLANEGRRLAAAARDGSIGAEELSGATFTITNLGAAGVRHFTPVLNPPQVAILGVGGIRPEPAFTGSVNEDGKKEVEHIPSIGLSLTIDHRAVDGAPAARFMKDLCDAIADIELTLAL